jgi:spermidine/putrescine transport system ATP-binding protein
MNQHAGKSSERPLLTIEDVQKNFGENIIALQNANFDIRDNELFTLLGPSGCGKTTLLRVIAGFEQPSKGRLLLNGKDIAGEPPFKRPVNTMFQSYALFPHLNVRQNISYGLEMLKWKKPDIAKRVDEVLSLVHMQDFADRRTTQMSGGQQQRIALARALAPRPRVLLLDEPLSALDLKLRKAMQIELKRLQKETALTFVLVTHDQEEALALSDRIAVMSKGKIQQIGTPEEIYRRPQNRFVADFIGEANLVPGDLIGRAANTTVCVRPENLTAMAAGSKSKGRLQGDVVTMTYLGADTLIEARISDSMSLRARMRGKPAGLEQGARAALDWASDDEWIVSE